MTLTSVQLNIIELGALEFGALSAESNKKFELFFIWSSSLIDNIEY